MMRVIFALLALGVTAAIFFGAIYIATAFLPFFCGCLLFGLRFSRLESSAHQLLCGGFEGGATVAQMTRSDGNANSLL